jgi:dUTP pyrophosphatase
MSKLPLKLKKLNDKAVVPSYGTDGAAALDLTAISEKPVFEGAVSYIEYGTGIAVEIPKGFVGLIFPRSSVSSATSMVLANSVGVIDSDYRGEIKFRFKSLLPSGGKKYNIGDRIGQLIVIPYPSVDVEVVEELSDTNRGTGGYGSTGK